MRQLWLSLCVLTRLVAQEPATPTQGAATTPPGSILVQACWAGPPGGKVHLVTKPSNQAIPLQAQASAIVANSIVPPCEGLELWVASAPQAKRVAEFPLPKSGQRFILVLQGEHPASMRAWLVPADLEVFPWGSACLLNLSDKRLRCRLNDQAGEVDPGKSGVIPFIATDRTSAHLTLDYQEGKQWLPDCSTKTILSPARRFILVVGPGLAAQGPLPKETVVETNPAPLIAPPPLPHPPAK
jgi:hypothetical protein